jgi:hypothetical protein
MERRAVLAACWLALAAMGCSASPQSTGQPSYTVSTEQLQRAIGERFPIRHKVEGLLNFDVQAPRLRLLPEQNRVATQMAIEVAGPALRRSYMGELDIDFALRYEPSDQSIRAHQLQLRAMRLFGLPQRSADVLELYGPKLADQALGEVVLHRLRPQDLALPDAMGLQPATITVEPHGLVIGFEKKQTP